MKHTFERNGKQYQVLVDAIRLPFRGQNITLTAGEITIDEEAQAWLVDKGNGENIVVEVNADEEITETEPPPAE